MPRCKCLSQAALFRARADQSNQAFSWIQADFESVLTQSNQYELQNLRINPEAVRIFSF